MILFRGFKYLTYGIGLYKIGEVGYNIGSEVYFRQFKEKQGLKELYGDCYALVFDATGDIGDAYAGSLAKDGFNLVLVGKNADILMTQKRLFEDHYKIQVKTIPFDLGQAGNLRNLEQLNSQIQDLDVGILVNGTDTYQIQKFEHLYPQEIRDTINNDILGTTLLLNNFVPKLLRRNRKSCIVNVGSTAGDCQAGYLSLYSATKAYTNALSRTMTQELQDRIDVVTGLPGPLHTDSHRKVFGRKEYETSYLAKLKDALINLVLLSDPYQSADDTLSLVGNKSEIPGTQKHLLYNVSERSFSGLIPRTWIASKLFERYGEKRTSNVSPYPLEPEQVQRETPKPQQQQQQKAKPVERPIHDVAKSLSHEFLLPSLTKEETK